MHLSYILSFGDTPLSDCHFLPTLLSNKLSDFYLHIFLVLQAPCNDISNLRRLSVPEQKDFAKRSSTQTVDIAKKAMSQFMLSQVIILARPRRSDCAQLEKLSKLSNSFLEQFCKEESKIIFGSNESMYSLTKGVQTTNYLDWPPLPPALCVMWPFLGHKKHF